VIEQHELPQRLYALKLRDLYGIGRKMEERLANKGITSVKALYSLNRQQLRSAWGGIDGEYMYDKLRGMEVQTRKRDRSSLGHSHVLPPEKRTINAALSVLHRLLQKACLRLRSYELLASKIQLRVKFLDHPAWITESDCSPTDDTRHLTHALEQLWKQYPSEKSMPYAVGISFSCLLEPSGSMIDLFQATETRTQNRLSHVLDKLNMRYGKNTVYFGGAHDALSYAPMRIAFNHIPDMKTEGDKPVNEGSA
jgi:DNA polymerase-4